MNHSNLNKRILYATIIYLIFLTPNCNINRTIIHDFNAKKHKFKSNKSSSIPNTFHFIWIGPKPFPIQSIKNIISFKKHHPNAHFIFWSDIPLEPLLDFLEVRVIDPKQFRLQEFYEKSQNVGQKSDIARFEILYKYGGIYADHDAICSRSLKPLTQNFDFVACCESGGKQLGIGLLISKPKHPIYNAILRKLEHLFRNDPTYIAKKTDKRAVINSTYNTFSIITFEQLGQNDLIAPSFYFYPIKQRSLFSKHLYQSYWIDDVSLVSKSQTNQIIKNNYICLKFLFFLTFFCSYFIVKKRYV